MNNTSQNLVQRMALASSWHLFDRVVRLVAGFVVGVLVARHYGPSGWGAINYVLASAILFGSIASAGSENLIVRDLSKSDSEQHRADIQKTALIVRLCFGLLSYCALVILVFTTQGLGLPLYLAAVYGLVFVFQASEIWEYRLRIEHRLPIIAKTHIFSSACSSLLKLMSILLGWPIICIAFAMLAEYALNLAVLARYRLRHWPGFIGTFQTQYARDLLRASSMVMLSGFLIACQSRSEFYLLAHFMDLEALGLYAAAFKCMEVVDVLVLVFTMTVMPELAKRDHLEFPILKRRTYLLGMFFFIATLIPIMLLYWIYPWIYGEKYIAAQAIIPWLALRPLLIILGAIRGIFLVMEGRLYYMPLCAFVGLLTTLLAGSALIPVWGLQGAAISGLIGLLISNVVMDIFFRPLNITNLLLCYREWPYASHRILEMLKMRKTHV